MEDILAPLKELDKDSQKRKIRINELTEAIQKQQEELDFERTTLANYSQAQKNAYLTILEKSYNALIAKNTALEQPAQNTEKDTEILKKEPDIAILQKYDTKLAEKVQREVNEAKERQAQQQTTRQTLEQKLTIPLLVEQGTDQLTIYLPIPHQNTEKPTLVRNLTAYILETLVIASDVNELQFDEKTPFEPYGKFSKLTLLTDQSEACLARIKKHKPDQYDTCNISIDTYDLEKVIDNTKQQVKKTLLRFRKKSAAEDETIEVILTENALKRRNLPLGRRDFWPESDTVIQLRFEGKKYTCSSPSRGKSIPGICNTKLVKAVSEKWHPNTPITYERTKESIFFDGKQIPIINVHL